ncbi:MAG: TonB-dependent receptor [Proteobacteria bacterium]|nr:TonB-dependent receptor [Pseudomonadota bacterium]MDA1151348.1 TonB-dependent receptor [Pseudomonadota bacterium]
MNRRKVRLTAAILSLWVTSAGAQETFELDDIVISGGNSPIKSTDLATSNSVITSEEIEKQGDVNVQSLLRQIPGLSVSAAGSSFSEIRIRGGEANHTLVLIDGVPATGGDGHYIFSGLSATDIERIEVMRGPQTIFFGPSASSGVINIISKTPEKNGGAFFGSVGSTSGAGISQNINLGNFATNVTILREDYEGYDQSYSNGDKDGFDRETLQIKTTASTDSGMAMTLKLRDASEKYDTDDYKGSTTDTQKYGYRSPTSHLDYVVDTNDNGKRDETQASIELKRNSDSGRVKHNLLLAHTEYSNSLNNIKSADNDQQLIRYHFQHSLDDKPISDAKKSVSVIAEHHNDKNQLNKAQKRLGNALAFEYRQKFYNYSTLQLGGRVENGNRYKAAQTWKIGYVLPLVQNSTSLLFDAGTAVVNPTYGEIYGTAWTNGNLNLRPEKNMSVSVALKQNFRNQDFLKATLFHDKLNNEIRADAAPYTPYNETGESKRKGIELEGQFYPQPQIKISGNYTYLVAKEPNGTVEARRPRHMLNSRIEYEFLESHGHIALSATRVVKNYDSYPGVWTSRKLPDYTKFDLSSSFKITEELSITGQISNLFDTDFSDNWGWRGSGRSFYLTANAKW